MNYINHYIANRGDELVQHLVGEGAGIALIAVASIGAGKRNSNSGEAAAEAAVAFQELLKRDRDWPLLFYEFWSFGVRSARIQGEFAKRRQAVQDALAETLDRLAAALGSATARISATCFDWYKMRDGKRV